MQKHEENKRAAEVDGKVVVVTGASKGIGEAAAREFASNGATVVLLARSSARLNDIASEINDAGGKALAMACDVADYTAVEKSIAQTNEKFGAVDILVNNAGLIDPISRLADSDPVGWNRAIDVNLKGVYHGCRAVLPGMLAQGGGIIINVSSGAASAALEGWSHYCSSKAAVLSLTRCIHAEYAEQGIRVVGLSPGTVATQMQISIKQSGINPVSQLDPDVHLPVEWPARAIVWLCSQEAKEFDGDDFAIKTDEARRRVGLIS